MLEIFHQAELFSYMGLIFLTGGSRFCPEGIRLQTNVSRLTLVPLRTFAFLIVPEEGADCPEEGETLSINVSQLTLIDSPSPPTSKIWRY